MKLLVWKREDWELSSSSAFFIDVNAVEWDDTGFSVQAAA